MEPSLEAVLTARGVPPYRCQHQHYWSTEKSIQNILPALKLSSMAQTVVECRALCECALGDVIPGETNTATFAKTLPKVVKTGEVSPE